MANVTLEYLTERLALGDELRLGRKDMLEPQDLPGAYGRVIKAIDRVLGSVGCESVVAGGWAVWRHGYVARLTQDVDIALASSQIDEFLRVAAVAGFDLLPVALGRWPKLQHKETKIDVDILPEGGRPGTASRPAPTTIPHPKVLGAEGTRLRYIELAALFELKLAAGRTRDENDVAELIRVNADRIDDIRQHLASVHYDYLQEFERLRLRAQELDP